MHHIPASFARHIELYFKADGVAWLRRLPGLLLECERRWSLIIQSPFELSYNYVAPAIRADGTDVVVKLGVPHPELITEIDALQIYDGRGMVRLLETDREQCLMLLERLKPGKMLVALADDVAATTIAAQVMQQFWQPIPAEHAFPTVGKWAAELAALRTRFDGGVGPYPKRLVEMAESWFADLLASMATPVLLHGDLHHYNILTATRQPWLAIDPKGVVGEPAYEAGALLRNPLPAFYWADYAAVLARRVDQLAEILGLDRQRIIGWGMAQAVLSSWWDFEEDGDDWQPVLRCAALLADLI